ncbi:unnamed protein product [Didymodactylos carnosus]|uniref:Uncharacterized protein n=2 Tax=Didymodactylos carnosus TaxID=1234261 RepID=A0A815IGU9_9BILA|nr:unnamed protein product [Didymodactylos carnosus]
MWSAGVLQVRPNPPENAFSRCEDEIELGELLLNRYCEQAAIIYDDKSIEILSLHAEQVRTHNGFAFTSAFAFESCIRFIKKKAHGTTQIAYWTNLTCMMHPNKTELSTTTGLNQIDLLHTSIDPFRQVLVNLLVNKQQQQKIKLFKRYKKFFITYHSILYDQRFSCASYIISFESDQQKTDYGNVILFLSYHEQYFVFVQLYERTKKLLSQYVTIPDEINNTLNDLYPLVRLTNNYSVISVDKIKHKCIRTQFEDAFCISEDRVDFEHD